MPGINLGKIQGSNSILKPPTHKYHFYGLGANLPPAGSFRYQKRPVLIGLKLKFCIHRCEDVGWKEFIQFWDILKIKSGTC